MKKTVAQTTATDGEGDFPAPDDPGRLGAEGPGLVKRAPLSCGGTVIVHMDRAMTCTEVDCHFAGTGGNMTLQHASFVPCRLVFESCPRCGAVEAT